MSLPWTSITIRPRPLVPDVDGLLEFSVNIALIAFFLPELAYKSYGRSVIQVTLLAYDAVQGLVHIFSHAFGIAAHIEVSAAGEPLPDGFSPRQKLMLDIDTFVLITRPSEVETRQNTLLVPGFPIFAVEVICRLVAFAEKEPGSSLCPPGAAFLDEGAKGRNACAWSDHNEVGSVGCR